MPEDILLSRDLKVFVFPPAQCLLLFADLHPTDPISLQVYCEFSFKDLHRKRIVMHKTGGEKRPCQQIISSISTKSHSVLSTMVQLDKSAFLQQAPLSPLPPHTPCTLLPLHLCQTVWRPAKSGERLLLADSVRGSVKDEAKLFSSRGGLWIVGDCIGRWGNHP